MLFCCSAIYPLQNSVQLRLFESCTYDSKYLAHRAAVSSYFLDTLKKWKLEIRFWEILFNAGTKNCMLGLREGGWNKRDLRMQFSRKTLIFFVKACVIHQEKTNGLKRGQKDYIRGPISPNSPSLGILNIYGFHRVCKIQSQTVCMMQLYKVKISQMFYKFCIFSTKRFAQIKVLWPVTLF